MSIESAFDIGFVASMAHREKQIQQRYRPVIGVHKWFARRPGTLFRALLLSEFVEGPLQDNFYKSHHLSDKTVLDPFMGGGTSIIEANRLGMKVLGADINPMSYWVVRQSLAHLDLDSFRREGERVTAEVEDQIGHLYQTRCTECGETATVKYYLWVKRYRCSFCGMPQDLFPGYLVARNIRHKYFVWYCPNCQNLAEISCPPSTDKPVKCPTCDSPLPVQSMVRRGRFTCNACEQVNKYPDPAVVPEHRLFAIEYSCSSCKHHHEGRYFKSPDQADLERFSTAKRLLGEITRTWIPENPILPGDESNRLRRWGYRFYRDVFNERQLLGLHSLLAAIASVEEQEIRWALATVFSDTLRYQNMLCRYDTMALKCQDVFSIHGFPISLVQCENNLLGIPGVGSGGFRHFVQKYIRAKEYCMAPYEVAEVESRKTLVHIEGEEIKAQFSDHPSHLNRAGAFLISADSSSLSLEPCSLDGVFTDPPYFDNVQYAELIDFCYVWLRKILEDQLPVFHKPTTRDDRELTGASRLSRGIVEFTDGLSSVFRKMAVALKPEAPLVFTYHHNDMRAYLPIIVAVLDSGLTCTSVLSCPAEMAASLHIRGTRSSTIDSVFVCRSKGCKQANNTSSLPECLSKNVAALKSSGIALTPGDLICLRLGQLSRIVINSLAPTWDSSLCTADRLKKAESALATLLDDRADEASGP